MLIVVAVVGQALYGGRRLGFPTARGRRSLLALATGWEGVGLFAVDPGRPRSAVDALADVGPAVGKGRSLP